MFYAVLTLLSNAIEQVLLADIVNGLGALKAVPLYYASAFIMVTAWLFLGRRFKQIHGDDIKSARKTINVYIVSGAIGNTFWFVSMVMLGLSGVAALSVIVRIFMIAYGVMILNESMSKAQLLATVVIFSCVFSFIQGGSEGTLLGVAFSAISSIGYAISAITQKKIPSEISVAPIIWWRQMVMTGVFVSLSCLALTIAPEWASQYVKPTTLSLTIEVLVCALIGGVLVQVFMLRALQSMDISRYVVLQQLKPIIILSFGIIFLGEVLTLQQVISVAVIFIAGFVAMRKPKVNK